MPRTLLGLLALAALLVPAFLALPLTARSESRADRALADAVARGKTLYTQPWAPGAKACVTCHGSGPNKLTGARLKTYPKWDKTADVVICGQQKINQMIAGKSGGAELALGSADLNALEAYIATLR
jgi:mono/diheme cytochrome c family protein